MPSMMLWVLGPLVLSLVFQRPELILLAVVLVVAQRYLPDPLRYVRSFQKRQTLTRTLAQNPHNAQAARQLAMLHLDANSPRQAVRVLELAKARNADAETLHLLGLARLNSGDVDAALTDVDAALALDERIRYGDAWLVKGRALHKKGDLDGAAAALTRFVAINGSSLEGHVRLARVEAARNNTDAARAQKAEAHDTWRALPAFQRKQQRVWWLRLLTGL